VIFAIIFVLSVSAMVLHFKVMKRRGAVDESLAVLDNLLRERIEIIYEMTEGAPETDELREKCAEFSAYDTRRLINSIFEIDEAAEILTEDRNFLDENIIETEQARAAFNDIINAYNAYIAIFPARIMAFFLGLSQEKMI